MTIKLRGDTAANWTAGNPTLAARQVGLETDTQKMKVGDGATAWNSLTYWFAGGSGTVTTVSVTTANGVSGSVANATTTPAITLTLGAITPSSVAAVGTVTGSNLSGTNTGDQTTVSGNAGSATVLQTSRNFSISGGGITAAIVGFDGSAAVALNASVDAGHITLARMADVATATVFYRKTAGTGAPEVQTLSTLKTDLGLSGINTGDQTSVTGNAGTATALQTGRTIGITGDVVWTSPSFDGTANVTAAGTIQAGTVTLAKMANMATASLIYRKTAGTGAPEVQTLATLKTDLGLTGTNSGDQTTIVGITGTLAEFNTALTGADFATGGGTATGTNTGDQTITLTGDVTGTGSGSFAATIAADAVTNAKMANMATATFKGRVTAGTGDPEDLTGTQATTLLDTFTSALKGLAPASGGGTTNFLRADGTWTAPGGGGGGSPGGSTTQIQFNDAGAFGGDADFVWDKTTNDLTLGGTDTGITMTGITNEPSAPSAGTLHYYSRAVAGRMLPKIKGPSGIDTIMQPAIFQNRILMYVPSTGTTGTGSGSGLGPVWTSGGTVSHPTPATTAPAISNQMRRTRYANVVTTANQTLGIKAAAADTRNYWRGNAAGLGGFFYCARFIVELYPASTVRIFAGLVASNTTYVVASDTVLNDTCGLWHDTTDPSTGAGAFNFVTRNTATTTKQAITLSNAIAAGNSYDFYMWCAPNGSEIFWRLDDIVNGVTYEGSTSTTLPTATAFMGPQCAMSNGTANTVVTTTAIGIAGVYTEADR